MPNTTVTFKSLNVKSLVTQLDGQEPPYPVYYFGGTAKQERPEVAGEKYRWAAGIQDDP